ncbi:BnaAnng04930D [Brassica napus]|uniref:BnaAnng04930D protein n=1 Tax=Brassica napus TaxID=3708 RepID=A0A078HIZ1_BRANA|nr:BnaAnng04930D [Brassica napus]
MGWWKKKKSRAVVKEQTWDRDQWRGEKILEALIQCCDGKPNSIKFFTADQILKATQKHFCNRVSELYFHGKWYSGTLDNHRMILLRKMKGRSPHPPRDICTGPPKDVAISSMVSDHKNFMKLVGCCFEFEYPVIVYYGGERQYSPVDLNKIVSWRRRMKIAEEVATALAYLHVAFPRPFVYRNMGLKNILLDKNGVAKLNDLSYCVSIPKGETHVKLTWAGKDYDYMDNDYIFNRVVSEKTDVFGFGVFMQKLLTGEKILRSFVKNKFPKWLSSYMGEGRMGEIVDPKMSLVLEVEERCLMEAFLVLSERCIGLRGEVPKMVEVAKELRRSLKQGE